ncbi:penicillin acylase family protein [Portibacter marinus]|uniref:penicillin acylase family protein n=1 Tax=Portibacter marinus TaxID=2898660 RepID=UPI001F29BE55|nr:penicillin acylase family protein [Portibacter marinus]
MSYVRPIVSFLLLIMLILGLSVPINMGGSVLPPIGEFMNPFTGFWSNAESGTHKNIDLTSEKLKEEVSIVYDERHVPHIFAQNTEDLLFAQGYVIAKERLWQMDITTRAVEGRNAEILGISALNRDQGARRKGLPRAAKLAAEAWGQSKEGFQLIQSFCDGINHYIGQLSSADLPLEFKLLDYQPEDWSPYRTALFVKAMAITLNSRNIDVATTNALNLFGENRFNDLYPDRNKKQSPIIQDVKYLPPSLSFEDRVNQAMDQFLNFNERSDQEQFIGSNNFAVSKEKSSTGHVILANDPHLKLTLPSIWIEMHLVCPEFNAYGVSLPGMPGIILGFNENISWGQTNVGHDVLDLYQIKWKDDSKREYLLDSTYQQSEWKIEEFRVKGQDAVKDTVFYTHWGPVLEDPISGLDLAQRWVSLDAPAPGEIDLYININRAKNYDEFQQALQSFSTPAQNFIFGSKDGDIAMTVTGKFPVKQNQQGRFIQDGSVSASAWKGFIPFDELPREKNPIRNYVSSANQHSTDESYPYYYNGGFEDFRGRYINRRLESMDQVSIQDLMNLQLDAYSLKAEEALPILLEHIDDKALSLKESGVLQSLQNWDYVYTSQSKAASYFEIFWNQFYDMVFDEISEARKELDIPYVEAFRLIEMMEEEEEHEIFDIDSTVIRESMSDIIYSSFKACQFDSIDVDVWSERRNTTIDHLTEIPAFGYNDINSPGHPNTPNAISRHAGPSWRMVVEMSDPVRGYGIYPGGISGNPGSPYYEHFVEDWDKGNYYRLNNTRKMEEIDVKQMVTLKPKQ